MMQTALFILLIFVATSFSQCVVADGAMPLNGTCEGPSQRAVLKSTNAETFNGGCPNNQVQYYKDGGSVSMCGQCVPGTSGVEDPEKICDINQFCNDNATCQDTKTSPLFNTPCPYEQGGTTAQGWCGPGLRCISHVCLPCENGVFDQSDGKRCFNHQWTYSEWDTIGDNPEAVLLLVILILMVIWMIVPIFVRKDKKGRLYVVGLKKVTDKLRKKIKAKVSSYKNKS